VNAGARRYGMRAIILSELASMGAREGKLSCEPWRAYPIVSWR